MAPRMLADRRLVGHWVELNSRSVRRNLLLWAMSNFLHARKCLDNFKLCAW
jgi:hypothetical protein